MSAASEAPLQRLIEAALDGIVVSRNGEMLFANRAAVRLLVERHRSAAKA